MLGDIECKKVLLNDEVIESMSKRFIALDTETTGLDCTKNVITEIGLVLFENGKKVKEYGSLLRVHEKLSPEITSITGITNEMLENAPSEESVYREVVEFLGDALEEETIIVAHNASFDMCFIERALVRFGYIGVIRYADTLSISRSLVKGLFNYKQDTVAQYFNIVNEQSHRALTDAVVCGRIMTNLINVYNNKSQIIEFETKYDDLFEEKVRERGIIYYRFNTINGYTVNGNEISALISGANVYNVSLKLGDKLEGTCDCPYYKDDKKLCKHMYSLLLKYTYSGKK